MDMCGALGDWWGIPIFCGYGEGLNGESTMVVSRMGMENEGVLVSMGVRTLGVDIDCVRVGMTVVVGGGVVGVVVGGGVGGVVGLTNVDGV